MQSVLDGAMARLRLPAKVGVLLAIVLVPLLVLTFGWLRDVHAELQAARQAADGSQAALQLLDVAVQTQTHRGQTNMLLSGNAAARQPLEATRGRLRGAIAAFDAAVASHPDWPLADEWRARRDELNALVEGRHADRAQAFAAHTQAIDKLAQLMTRVGEASHLLQQPDLSAYFVAETTVERLLPWSETLGLLRGQGAGLLSRDEASAAELHLLFGRLQVLEQQLQGLQARTDAITRHGQSVPPQYESAVERTRAFAGGVRRAFEGEKPNGDPAAYFAAGTQAIEAVVAFQQALGKSLAQALDERSAADTQRRNLAFVWLALGAALLAFAGRAVLRSMTRPLHEAVAVAEQVAEGDLRARIVPRGRDEAAQLLQALARMTRQLETTCRGVRGGTEAIASASTQIAQGNQDLSARTERQAAALQQTAASMEQLAATVRQNADRAVQARDLAREAAEVAGNGSRAVDGLVQAMRGLNDGATQIATIVGTIEGIALRTNMLALNAAVEAARAGGQGRGFAIVAGEVRSLAQRASAAAREIKALVDDSVERVAQRNQRAEQAGATMRRVDDAVQKMSVIAGEISAATREQSEGVAQVGQAVVQLDETTQQNAALVEETAAAADSLRRQAQQLVQATAVFRFAAA